MFIFKPNMRVTPINPYFRNNLNLHRYSTLSPLKCDTVSFCAMKKSEFDGINLAVINKFKAPIEQFNNVDDLNLWANKEVDKIVNKNYKAIDDDTTLQRRGFLSEWFNYVREENGAYNPIHQLIILDAVVKDLDENNKYLPFALNKGVLADSVVELEKRIKENQKNKFNFNKLYKSKMLEYYLQDTDTGLDTTGWIIIPSKKNDPDNFEVNVEKLKALSHQSWCTKSYNAEPFLKTGDFHIYLENGKPKLGVGFSNDKITEIQGERNNGKIPIRYLDTLKQYLNENNYELGYRAKYQITNAEDTKKEAQNIKNDLKIDINKKLSMDDSIKIFNYFGIKTKKTDDNKLIISHFRQPKNFITFYDLGINGDELLKDVVEIEKDADFQYSEVTDLPSLRKIGWHANFYGSNSINLPLLSLIGGDADFRFSKITKLPSLISVGQNAYFENSRIIDLYSLKSINGKDVNPEEVLAQIKKPIEQITFP